MPTSLPTNAAKATGWSRASKTRRGRQGRNGSRRRAISTEARSSLRPGDPAAQTLSLVAGLALIEAIDVAAPTQPMILKWPNDVLLGQQARRHPSRAERRPRRHRLRSQSGVAPRICRTAPAHRYRARSRPRPSHPCSQLVSRGCSNCGAIASRALLAQAWLARAHPIGTPLTVHSAAKRSSAAASMELIPTERSDFGLIDGRIEIVRAGDVLLP